MVVWWVERKYQFHLLLELGYGTAQKIMCFVLLFSMCSDSLAALFWICRSV